VPESKPLEQAEPTSMYLNRYSVAADLKAYYPAAHGITPYGFLGAGAVLLHERGSTGADKTQGFAHLGLGIAYAVGKSGLSIFAQGDGLGYSLTDVITPTFETVSKAQIDVGWNAGASYRLPL